MALSKSVLDSVDKIRRSHDQAGAAIRGRAHLTEDARAAQLAQNFLRGKQELADLQQTSAAEDATRRQRLERSVFGTSDLPGDSATSMRDALDRTATLRSSADAAQMYARAERSGDEVLCRALATRSYDALLSGEGQLDNGWSEVLATHVNARPAAASAVRELEGMLAPATNGELFTFVLPTPPELSRVPGSQVASLAARAV